MNHGNCLNKQKLKKIKTVYPACRAGQYCVITDVKLFYQ